MKTMNIPVLLFFVSFLTTGLSAGSTEENASQFLCQKTREKGKSRLAFFPFTNSGEDETKETERSMTKVIAGVLNCGDIQVIDKSKLDKILNEQALEKSGLFDSESVPEFGKLMGADSLVFGIIDTKSLQLRLVDAETGEVLGANVEDKEGKEATEIKVEKFSREASKMKLDDMLLRKALTRLRKNRPGIFIYTTSTDAEFKEFGSKYPAKSRLIMKRLEALENPRKEKILKLRSRILNLRNTDPKYSEKLKSIRGELFDREE